VVAENPFERLRRLEKYLIGLPLARNRNMLSREQRDVANLLLDNMALARRQFEYSAGDEDAVARSKGFLLTTEQLKVVHKNLLHPAIQDSLTAADVAQLTSLADLCIEDVKSLIQRS
jgi:hypothetical protein